MPQWVLILQAFGDYLRVHQGFIMSTDAKDSGERQYNNQLELYI